MTGREALQAEVLLTKRAVELLEARYMGLIRASVAGEPVLWFSRDVVLQRQFQAGFTHGRTLLDGAADVEES